MVFVSSARSTRTGSSPLTTPSIGINFDPPIVNVHMLGVPGLGTFEGANTTATGAALASFLSEVLSTPTLGSNLPAPVTTGSYASEAFLNTTSASTAATIQHSDASAKLSASLATGFVLGLALAAMML